jgi:hypothetical protein
MSNNNRPEWAQGPEWDGWEGICTQFCVTRKIMDRTILRISRTMDGRCRVGKGHATSPATALAIANLIAEDRGGWA